MRRDLSGEKNCLNFVRTFDSDKVSKKDLQKSAISFLLFFFNMKGPSKNWISREMLFKSLFYTIIIEQRRPSIPASHTNSYVLSELSKNQMAEWYTLNSLHELRIRVKMHSPCWTKGMYTNGNHGARGERAPVGRYYHLPALGSLFEVEENPWPCIA